MTDTNTGSTIRFTNDEQRKVFQLKMALGVLESEVINTMGIRFYRGSIINVLKRYFPDLPRTKRSAYKYLKHFLIFLELKDQLTSILNKKGFIL